MAAVATKRKYLQLFYYYTTAGTGTTSTTTFTTTTTTTTITIPPYTTTTTDTTTTPTTTTTTTSMYVLCRKEMFYLTTHSTHFIYGYMASDIWLRTIQILRKETRCRHIGYSFRLTARVLLYAPSHRQDSTYHGLFYTSRGALAGTRNSSMGPPHE